MGMIYSLFIYMIYLAYDLSLTLVDSVIYKLKLFLDPIDLRPAGKPLSIKEV